MNQEVKKSIGGVAGRSGGHLIPCINLLLKSVEDNPRYEIIFFSTATDLDRSIAALYPQITSIPLELDPFPGKNIFRYPRFFIQALQAFIKSLKTLKKKNVERIVTTGSYISLPVCAAAWCLRIPIEGYELNAVPGKAVALIAPYAKKVYLCFDEAVSFFKRARCTKVSYPLRFTDQQRVTQSQGLAYYKLNPQKKTLLLLGGSQGSQSLNELIQTFFKSNTSITSQIQVIHQTGAGKSSSLRSFYQEHSIDARVLEYEPHLEYAYAAADYAITRAGAGTLFELEFFNKKSLIIPLELSHNDHQLYNALAFAARRPESFIVGRQKELIADSNYFMQCILKGLELEESRTLNR